MRRSFLFVISAITLFALTIISCAKEEKFQNQTNYITDSSAIRSYSEAEQCALSSISLLEQGTKTRGRRILNGGCITKPRTKGSAKDTILYYFNFSRGEGFAIVNANKHFDPFVCVTESGSYDEVNRTGVPAVDEYLKRVENRGGELPPPIEFEDSLDVPIIPYSYTIEEYNGDYVDPLLITKWGQTGVFGAYCPNGIAGCAATAIGQIIAYHHYPQSITLSTSAGPYSQGSVIPLNWNYIDNHIKNHAGAQICNDYHYQISALLRDIGEQLFVSYEPGGSGCSPYSVPFAFYHYGYSLASLISANVSTIVSSLNNNKPVFMGGSLSQGAGHAWVADGYKDYLLYRNTYAQAYPNPGYYLVNSVFLEEVHALHINWGWEGLCDGYFNFNCYDTSMAISYDEGGGAYYNFCEDVLMSANLNHYAN